MKSTSRLKGEHLDDLAIQAFVLRGAGLAVDAACLMHVNTGYLYPGGPLDLQQLFQEQDLTGEVANRQGELPTRLARMLEMVAGGYGARGVITSGVLTTPWRWKAPSLTI